MRCEEGYQCEVCGKDVESLEESDLYLRFVIGQLDPETLHTAPERHIRCNPVLAQFIQSDDFPAVPVSGPFSKSELDPEFVRKQSELVTQGWLRLREIATSEGIPVHEYPLPEVRSRWR